MLNPNEIDPKHLPTLNTALMKHRSKLDEHRVAKLYAEARTLVLGSDLSVAQAQDKSVMRSVIRSQALTIVTCTDAETGLFVQLAGLEGGKGLLLTFGQKFCQEARDVMRQNVATKVW